MSRLIGPKPKCLTAVAAFVAACTPVASSAQTTGGVLSDGPLDSVRNHVSIRQSLEDKNAIDEPAIVDVTLDDGGARVKEVAAAVEAWVFDDRTAAFNVGVATQFNESNRPGERVNQFVTGGELMARTGGAAPSYFGRAKAIVGYKRNGENHTNEFATRVYVTLEKYRKDSDTTTLPVGSEHLLIAPQAGIEYGNIIDAEKVDDQGSVTRGMVSGSLTWLPLTKPNPNPADPGGPARMVSNRLAFSANFAFRGDLSSDFDGDRTHPYAALTASVSLDRYDIVRFGIDRVMGDDPADDFANKRYWRFGLRVQLKKSEKSSVERIRAGEANLRNAAAVAPGVAAKALPVQTRPVF